MYAGFVVIQCQSFSLKFCFLLSCFMNIALVLNSHRENLQLHAQPTEPPRCSSWKEAEHIRI